MKNSLKNKKSILAARVMLIILLLTSAVSLAGCGWNYQEEGYYYPREHKYYLGQRSKSNWEIMEIFAVSDTNVFPVDNITFDLIYGTHASKYMGVRETNRIYDADCYTYYYENPDHSLQGEYCFALYLVDGEDSKNFQNEDARIGEIDCIENYQLFKKISEEQAFSEEYGYVVYGHFRIVATKYFKHIENFTVPAEYVKDKQGSFIINIIAYWKDYNKDYYIVDEDRVIVFEYEKIDENTVKIEFSESNTRRDK